MAATLNQRIVTRISLLTSDLRSDDFIWFSEETAGRYGFRYISRHVPIMLHDSVANDEGSVGHVREASISAGCANRGSSFTIASGRRQLQQFHYFVAQLLNLVIVGGKP